MIEKNQKVKTGRPEKPTEIYLDELIYGLLILGGEGTYYQIMSAQKISNGQDGIERATMEAIKQKMVSRDGDVLKLNYESDKVQLMMPILENPLYWELRNDLKDAGITQKQIVDFFRVVQKHASASPQEQKEEFIILTLCNCIKRLVEYGKSEKDIKTLINSQLEEFFDDKGHIKD